MLPTVLKETELLISANPLFHDLIGRKLLSLSPSHCYPHLPSLAFISIKLSDVNKALAEFLTVCQEEPHFVHAESQTSLRLLLSQLVYL